MKKVIQLLALIILLVCSCKDEEPTAPSNGNPPVGEVKIGVNGGVLEAEGFKLTVPPNSFSSENTLKLTVDPTDDPFGVNSISKLFIIDGIPADFNLPLEVSIKYEGTLSGLNIIAIGQETSIEFLDSILVDILFSLEEASESSGYLTCEIQPNPGPTQLHKKRNIEDPISSYIGALTGGNVWTYLDHFNITETLPEDKQAQIDELHLLLEQSFQRFLNLGFDYTKRVWPLDVDIIEFSSWLNLFMGYNNDKNKLICKMTTDFKPFTNFDKAIIESYFFTSILYKYNIPANHLWIGSALVNWSQIRIHTFDHSQKSALRKWINGFPKSHYCGLLIEYLANQYGEEKLSIILQEVENGKDPIDALIDNTAHQSVWLADFYKYLMTDEKYNFAKASFWLDNCDVEFLIEETTSQIEWVETHGELSAKWYRFDLAQNLDQTTELVFSADGSDAEISLFKHKNDEVIFVDNSVGDLMLTDVRTLADQGYNLIAVVTNLKNSSESITLTVTKPSGINLTWGYFIIRVGAKIMQINPPDTSYYDTEFFMENTVTGSYQANVFEAEWDSIDNLGNRLYGTLKVTFSNDLQNLLSVEFSDNQLYQGGINYDYRNVEVFNIPYDYNNWYKVDGDETCNHITNIAWEQRIGTVRTILLEKTCIGFTNYIRVSFSELE